MENTPNGQVVTKAPTSASAPKLLFVRTEADKATKKRLQEETFRRHGTNPAELEAKILLHTNNESCGDCWTQSPQLLKEVWDTFPKCPVGFTVRNFNNFRGGTVKTVEVLVPGLGWGRAYDHNVSIRGLCPKLESFLKFLMNNRGSIPIDIFQDNGREIAGILERRFILTHQQGGDQSTADFNEYVFDPPRTSR